MDLFEKQVSTKEIFKGRIFTVSEDDIILPNGKDAKREVITHNGGVGILPLCDNGDVILVKQFRYPTGKAILEIPAGKLEKGENHFECGVRELTEEAGAVSNKIDYLGEMYPTPAYCTEIIHIYLARELSFEEQNLDEDEFLDVIRIPFEKALDMVMKNEITDGKTQIAILKTAQIIK